MHFVEDVDLVARADRRVADRVVDLAHVVDAVVRGGVHLDHVDVPALHDRLAVHAEHRHLDGRPGDRAVGQFVIERAREDARGRGLADAAHAGEDPGLRDAAGLERVRDRAHHGVLADQVVEGRRPVFAREHAVGAGRRRGAAPSRARSLGVRRCRIVTCASPGCVGRHRCRNLTEITGSRLAAMDSGSRPRMTCQSCVNSVGG